MPGRDPVAPLRAWLAEHAQYLRNPLPAGAGICMTCRGPAGSSFLRCIPCDKHFRAAPDSMADVVAPISYAHAHEQHMHDLRTYKWRTPPEISRSRLLSLLVVFLADHGRCLVEAAGGTAPSAAAVVPSTKGRPGLHPLRTLIGDRLGLPWLPLAPGARPDGQSRTFQRDRFGLNDRAREWVEGRTVLLIDDTWTTGSRIQSASHTLKAAGAAKVVAVVLGRRVNPVWDEWRPILQKVRDEPFRMDDCPFHIR
ncbi:hypothetical protein GCM10022416_14780 [Actinomadura keratinilytica]|uniref:Phosphoribosyltransferase n=2 Tax=Actinomadura keratinilytica TaxID=547461 RepID=A0ABP7YBC9_9ACTN